MFFKRKNKINPIDLKKEKEFNKDSIARPVKPKKKVLKFPDNFFWGVSTSAYQIEGGIKNDWSEWETSKKRIKQLKKQNKNSDDFICGQACDSYNRYEEDLDLVKKLNCNAYRFSLEWARIQPKKNTWNVSAINHYRHELKVAKKRGLTTVVTIWHYSNPDWVARENGWNNKKIINYFLEYVEMVVKELDVYVDYWVTLNEPTVHVANGYLTGKFPPNKKNIWKAIKIFNNLAKAHNKSYELIHKYFPKSLVSVAMMVNYFEPAHHWCPLDQAVSKIAEYFSNSLFLNKIKNHIDYVGFDYYFHDRIVWYPPFKKNLNKKTTDMGWEIYPKGIYYVLKDLAKYKKPILILENGLADAKDKQRADFIRGHLYYVHKAIQEGADVRGYFYWSLLDNFEWDSGWFPKFGLYWMDRQTFERKEKPSAQVYQEICKNNKITLG